VGVHRETLRELMQGCLPIQRTYERLQVVFGDRLPPTYTETERRRRVIMQHQGNPHTPEAIAKSAASRRGRPQCPERGAKRVAPMNARGHYERVVPMLAVVTRSLERRCLAGLPNRLRANPDPSARERQQWAEETGRAVGVPPAAVLAIWRPYLRKRKLVHLGGRPLLEKRHRLITDLMADWPRSASGRLSSGFWPEAALRVSRSEGQSAPSTYQSLKQWWSDHQGTCADAFRQASAGR